MPDGWTEADTLDVRLEFRASSEIVTPSQWWLVDPEQTIVATGRGTLDFSERSDTM